ncbi:MAG: hypothetical protein HQ518_10535 [Rhodopirellula sp.]|nr:hypothetical protein [Rhodopirellula sp.]
MSTPSPALTGPPTYLDEISTRWGEVGNPRQFVMRYATAIRCYLASLIRNPTDADDVCQDFLLNVLTHRFAQASPDRGRFRKYLKTAVRNAALMHYRHARRSSAPGQLSHEAELCLIEKHADSDTQWLDAWGACLLERTWSELHGHQRRTPGNMFHTALRLWVDHPDDNSNQLAARATQILNRPVQPDNFRKQLSRARRLFAERLVAEATQTLETPSLEEVRSELQDLGLLRWVGRYLETQG